MHVKKLTHAVGYFDIYTIFFFYPKYNDRVYNNTNEARYLTDVFTEIYYSILLILHFRHEYECITL